MGYMRHHAIVITSGGYAHADAALKATHVKARELGCCVTPITETVTNGYQSFLVAPDGSKEGWEESEAGDGRRTDLIAFMETFRYTDGSSPLEWVEVQFGDDRLETCVVLDSDADRRSARQQVEA